MKTLKRFGMRILLAALSFVMALVVVYIAREFGWRMADREAFGTVAAIWGVVWLVAKFRQKGSPSTPQSAEAMPGASVDTSNPAIGGQGKPGHRSGRSRPDVL